jgi:hypothetical protein
MNQDDLEERTQQVPLIRFIYQEAAWAIAWGREAGARVTKESIDIILEIPEIFESLSSQLRPPLHSAKSFTDA